MLLICALIWLNVLQIFFVYKDVIYYLCDEMHRLFILL